MLVAIPIFDGLTALDAVGPYEVLARLPGAEVRFASARGPGHAHRSEDGMLVLQATAALDDVSSPDVLVVPGGRGTRALLDDETLLGWIRGASASASWTASVCTGALLLAAAGLLAGREATTHWAAAGELEALGARYVARRVVEEGSLMTAAGVSAGIDMALALAARLAGEQAARAIQLALEYDPRPPFDSGSAASASPALRAAAASAEGLRAAGA